MKLLDTNIIIRFLLNDHSTQSPASKKLLETSDALILTDVAIAEIVWLLSSFYKLPKEEIVEKIYELFKINSLIVNKQPILRALYFYQNLSIDFIDAYLTAYAEEERLEGIYSFDKSLDKIREIKRFEPK